MKNILILKFPYSSLFGGGEKHTLTIVENLRKQGFNFHLVTSCPVLIEEFKKRNWPYEKIRAPKEPVAKWSILLFPFLAPFFCLKLKKILKKYQNLDAVFCLSLTEKLLLKTNLKKVWMEHVSVERWLTKNPFKFLYKKNSRAAKIITASDFIKNELIKMGIDQKNLETIYFGLENVERIKNYSFDGNLKIGCTARLEEEKGVKTLIEAFKKLHGRNDKLTILGRGSQEGELKKMAKGYNIEFAGFQNNLDDWHKKFNLFVLPSKRRESFGIALLEALSWQTPVIASNLGGIPEIITDHQTGLLFEPGNAQELADKIIWARENYPLMLKMAQNGQEMVKEKFNLENTIKSFKNALS